MSKHLCGDEADYWEDMCKREEQRAAAIGQQLVAEHLLHNAVVEVLVKRLEQAEQLLQCAKLGLLNAPGHDEGWESQMQPIVKQIDDYLTKGTKHED